MEKMKDNIKIITIVVVMLMIIMPTVSGQSYGGAPSIDVDPVIDGLATNFDEWAGAGSYPNGFNDGVYSNAGTFYSENKIDWNATSSSGNSTIIPGVTFFLAHDIWGQPTGDFSMFRFQDESDWNVAEFTYEGVLVEAWVFADIDEPDDSVWLPWSGLADSTLIPEGGDSNKINDTGFIVRLNGNPSTDSHWFPGDPEPGDPLWDESKYYGVFARAGFDNSFYATGIDTDPAHSDDNEVYEWKITGSTTTGIPPLLHSTNIKFVIKDPPKYGKVYTSDEWFIHLGGFFENIGPHYQDIFPEETAVYEIILENPMPEFPVDECKETYREAGVTMCEPPGGGPLIPCDQLCEDLEAEIEEDTIILSAENIYEEGPCTWDWVLSHDRVHFTDANDWTTVTLKVTAGEDCKPSSLKKIKVSAKSEKMELRGEVWIDTVVKTTHVIPEFATIAIPVAAILGLLFLFSRRKKT